MSKIQDEILVASGGLNYDDDPRAFQQGDTDYRLNVIPTAVGDTYVLTNIKGTTKKEHTFDHDSSYDGAVYTTIGSCYDIQRNAVYFFIYSDLTNHCILRYVIDDDDFEQIVWDNPNIGLDPDYPIADAFMIDNWLYWNPRSSSPRAINVQWAYYDYNTTLVSGGTAAYVGSYYRDRLNRVWLCIQSTADSSDPQDKPDYFTYVDRLYYYVPRDIFDYFFNTTHVLTESPLATLESDTSYEFNNIRGKTFQFAYRLYIPELGLSTASPFSGVVVGLNSETYNGEFGGEITTDNKISLKLELPKRVVDGVRGTNAYNIYLFDYLEILVRSNYNDSWRSVDRVPYESMYDVAGQTGSFTYDFYNDGVYAEVDSSSVEKPFNYLPVTARAQCALDGERSAYFGIVEGRNFRSLIDVTLEDSVIQVEYEADEGSGAAAATFTVGSGISQTSYYDPYDGRPTYQLRFPNTGNLFTGAYTDYVIAATIDGVTKSYKLIYDDIDSNVHYAEAWLALLNRFGSKWWTLETGPYLTTTDDSADIDITLNLYASSQTTSPLDRYSSFKSGAWHNLCLFYYDELLRRSDAIKLDPVYIPFITELGESAGTGYRHTIDYTISHEPPSWARAWGFGYAGNASIDSFWQYNIAGADISADGDERDGYSYVDITPLQGITDDSSLDYNFLNTIIEAYSFVEGDRIRFMTDVNAAATEDADLSIDDWSSVQHDYEIVDFDATTNRVYFQSGGVIGDTTAGVEIDYNAPSVFVEIYRKKESASDVIYAEVGVLSDVLYSAGSYVHTNASGTLAGGDVVLMTRTMSKKPAAGWSPATSPVYLESYHWSDFYESLAWRRGKIGADFDINSKELNICRYSNKYVENSKMSGLGTFDGLDYKDLSSNFGVISAARQIGFTLKVIFENNVASVLINKTQFYDQDGVSQVVKSDDVLGSINYSEEAWGTVNPESVLVVDRDIYFMDLTRKAYVRNSSNGSFPISSYKMNKFFRDETDALKRLSLADIRIYSGWDDKNGLLNVGFSDIEQYDDWVLPTKNDLSSAYTNLYLNNIGGFSGTYWTCSEEDYEYAWKQIFTNGAQSISPKGFEHKVRACRYFRDDTQSYSVGDRGPAGGYVSYGPIDTSGAQWYIEFAKEDSANSDWSNITDVAVGTTSTNYLSGLGSSTHIVDQSGHTASAAKLCLDLTANWNSATTCVLYHPPSDRWVAFTSPAEDVTQTGYECPLMVTTPSGIISFIGEDLYLHDDNDTRCYLWGTQQEYTARVYSTKASNIIKQFDSIALHTNKYWDVSDIQIPATLNYPNGMQSRIKEARFEKEEGVLRSNYLCNMKSTSSTANVKDLFNGDALRGYIIYHDLDGDETVKHTLYKVDVLSTPSKY